jgi:hypothetical protein
MSTALHRNLPALVLLASFVCPGAGLDAQCVVPPEMLGWWSMDELAPALSGSSDISWGHDGALWSLFVGPPVPVPGKAGGALRFAGMAVGGVNGVLVPYAPELSLGTSDLSVDAWVRLDAFPTSVMISGGVPAQYASILSTGHELSAGNDWFTFGLGEHEGSAELMLAMVDTDAGVGSFHRSEGADIPVGSWVHVAVSAARTTGDVVFYMNGQAVGTVTVQGPLVAESVDLDPAEQLMIGAANNGAWSLRALDGTLDEVELFHRVLAPSEVLSIAVHGKCKDFAHVPLMDVLCGAETSRDIAVTLRNESAVSADYRWWLEALPAGGLCTAAGPTGFDLPGAAAFVNVTLPAGGSQSWIATLHHPTLALGDLSCYRVVAENLDTGHVFDAKGLLQRLPCPSAAPLEGVGPLLSVVPGAAQTLSFALGDVAGVGSSVDYELRVIVDGPGSLLPSPPKLQGVSTGSTPAAASGAAGAQTVPGFMSGSFAAGAGRLSGPRATPVDLLDFLIPESQAVSLEGLSPGTPVTGQLAVPMGGVGVLDVSVDFEIHVPLVTLDVVLLADLDGDGVAEVVASKGIRSSVP